MIQTMKKCPTCESARFWKLAPIGYLPVKGRPGVIRRCETCKGWGIATLTAIMGWELSL